MIFLKERVFMEKESLFSTDENHRKKFVMIAKNDTMAL
jgi:hypothetical protein